MRLVACAFLASLAISSPALAAPRDAGWVASWAASPSDPLPGVTPPSPSFHDQTVRTVAHLSLGGTALRIRLSNALGTAPLHVGAVHVARWENGAPVPGTDHVVTFTGSGDITIPIHAQMVSDPVALPPQSGHDIELSLYFPDETGPITEHALAVQTGWVAAGDQAAAATLADARTIDVRPVLSVVETLHPGAATIVTLGDSITDGQHSTPDADARWPDDLARRFLAAGRPVAVANAGINGNRLLSQSHVGPDALARLDGDVIALAGARSVIVLLGINDIGHAPDTPVTTAQIINALRQIATRAHDAGLRVVGATLLPFENSPYWATSGEAMRQAVNGFIRTGHAFDAVIDFDRITRDPADPKRLRPDYDSGDHLHPNDQGYRAMADAIDLDTVLPPSR